MSIPFATSAAQKQTVAQIVEAIDTSAEANADTLISVTITPKKVGNKLKVDFSGTLRKYVNTDGEAQANFYIRRNGSNVRSLAKAFSTYHHDGSTTTRESEIFPFSFSHTENVTSLSDITFSLYVTSGGVGGISGGGASGYNPYKYACVTEYEV